nr:8681_t:CDS:2 [Entrophospora candida]
MTGFQNSNNNNNNKLYTDSSNTNTALTTTGGTTHYIQSSQHHPNTPPSPSTTVPTANNNALQQQKQLLSSSPNSGSRSAPAIITSQSAFTPYNNHSSPTINPTPVTTPPNTSSTTAPTTTMMTTTSHLDNNGSSTAATLIYPPHSHFQNPAATHQFWQAQWSFGSPNQPNGTTAMIPTSNSAFVPAVGYGGNSLAPPSHTPRPKLTTTIWEDEGTLCYQVDARGICVARRQGKRDGILKNEKGRVVVKVGAMHLKGVWITFQRAKTLATQFKINELLYPVFVDDPSIFLHNSYGPAMSTRIPSIGNGPASQWRPSPHYVNSFGSSQYTTSDATRPWYPYGGGNGATTQMLAAAAASNNPSSQDHSQNSYPPAAGYPERNGNIQNNPPAVPVYSTNANSNSRSHPSSHSHPPAHIDDYDTGYGLINSQSQSQNGVTVVSNQNNEDNTTTSNGNGYLRVYNNFVDSNHTNGSTSQLIGQKRGFVTDDDNEDYNNNNNQPSPPLAMHPPPPPLNNIASAAINVTAAGSFPSPMNMSPNSSPGNSASAFSGWNNNSKRIKYDYPEATTPSSAQSSPRISTNYQQLPGLGNGPATPSSTNNSTHGYTSSNLQMVTNASSQQNSPHHYSPSSSSSNNNSNAGNGSATGTTTPTTNTDGLVDRYFDQGTVLHTPSTPENVVNTPVEEPNSINGRRYDHQYRQREGSSAEELNATWD